MIIYKDIITGDEMFSDIYKITESSDGMMLMVEGKLVTRSENIDDALIGGNASAEGGDEGTEASTVSGVDIIMNHKLQETSFDKKGYMGYIKDYMKVIKGKLGETNPDRVAPFMSGAAVQVKKILGNINNYQFFTGESMNPDGMIGLLDYHENGTTPFMLFFKDGLEMEKC